jgi:hypothetical protein
MLSFSELLLLFSFGSIGWYWLDAQRAYEQARSVAQRACREAGVQLLDDTVALARLRFRRQLNGHIGLYREFRFEFTADGAARFMGLLALHGRALRYIELGTHAPRMERDPPRGPDTWH